MYRIQKEIKTFINNNSKRNSKLFIIKKIDDLKKIKVLSKYQLTQLKNSSKLNVKKPVLDLRDFNSDILVSIALLQPSNEFRASTIDQAANIALRLEEKKWDTIFLSNFNKDDIYNFLLGWGLSFYNFNISKIKSSNKYLNVNSISTINKDLIEDCKVELESIFMSRDLINLPSNYLNPEKYENEIKKIFKKNKINVFKGKNFSKDFPLISIVGRAAEFEPRLIEVNWKNKKISPKKNNLTIIGKGITFDSGGLDIKPSGSMLNMKKDMGGSAIAIGLANALIKQNSYLNLRVLIPIAENAISHKSMRPLDIQFSRNNTPVEIGNTDAEGRLVLADALTFAQESKHKPDLIIDFATLTGAARVALGTEIPALFSNNEKISRKILNNSNKLSDPVWELPLFSAYERFLLSENGALNSTGFVGTGGAITAALFLQRFVKKDTNWIHIDLMGWNTFSRPGFPKGGESMSFRTILKTINDMFN